MEVLVFIAGVGVGVLLAAARPQKDALTGLPLREAIPRWLFWHRGPVTAVIADLNGLKHINDTRGHTAGDAAISGLAHCIRGAVRRGDLAVRLGGDEFLVLAQTSDTAAVAGRVRRACRDAGVAAAVGGATGPGHRLAVTMARADCRMYAEKGARRRGRDRSLARPVYRGEGTVGGPGHCRAQGG